MKQKQRAYKEEKSQRKTILLFSAILFPQKVQFLQSVLFSWLHRLLQSQAVLRPEEKSTSMFFIFVNSQTASSPVKVLI